MARSLQHVWVNLANSLREIYTRYFGAITRLPSAVGTEEALGRGVFDSRKAKQAQRGKVIPGLFRERTGIRELSVDRLSFGGHALISEIHDSERPGQQFRGWAKVSVKDAADSGRTVVARPEPANSYHAEILLPDLIGLDADEVQDQHALNLAMRAEWLPRPGESQVKQAQPG